MWRHPRSPSGWVKSCDPLSSQIGLLPWPTNHNTHRFLDENTPLMPYSHILTVMRAIRASNVSFWAEARSDMLPLANTLAGSTMGNRTYCGLGCQHDGLHSFPDCSEWEDQSQDRYINRWTGALTMTNNSQGRRRAFPSAESHRHHRLEQRPCSDRVFAVINARLGILGILQ